MRGPFSAVAASQNEIAAARAGDEIVAHANVVMDRAFTVDAPPAAVWPWLLQLGKRRAGWYLPASVERFLPAKRRAARAIQPAWQQLRVGDVIPDYGREETFEVAILTAPTTLVYRSRRGKLDLSWSITLMSQPATDRTRLHFRLRLGTVRHRWLAETGGDVLDALTIVGLAAGLRERLRS